MSNEEVDFVEGEAEESGDEASTDESEEDEEEEGCTS